MLALEPIDIAIKDASYVFFAPRIRKIGQDVKSDVTSKFRDAIRVLKRGTSVIYALPTGIGGNNENIALIEHVTGLSVGKDVFYYYMPQCNSNVASSSEILVGSFKSKQDVQISRMLYDPDVRRKLSFIDIFSAEFVHSIKILGHYSSMASIFEICKHVPNM